MFTVVVFGVSGVFSVTDLFRNSSVRVCCLGNTAYRKEIYHDVNHTQKHGPRRWKIRSIPLRCGALDDCCESLGGTSVPTITSN